MNATERMALCADLSLDWTMAVMRSFHYSSEEISEALDNMPREVLDSWYRTLPMVEFVAKDLDF